MRYLNGRSGSWTGDYNKEGQNFVQALERVKKLVPAKDKLRLDRLQSFGQGEELKQRTRIAFEDITSLLELDALVRIRRLILVENMVMMSL